MRYGSQFESLMAEVCRDFGVKLVKSWDAEASKDEIREFVEEAIKNFFELPPPDEEKPKPKPKAKAKKTKKAKSEKAGEDAESSSPGPEEKKVVAPKGKPKCQAMTAKGSACSKCAVDGGPFCTLHSKTKKKPVVDEPPKKKCDEPGPEISADPPATDAEEEETSSVAEEVDYLFGEDAFLDE